MSLVPIWAGLALWVVPIVVQDQPLTPVWSPDHQTLASTAVNQAFVTPEGADYKLLLNGSRVYPPKPKHHVTGYQGQHTFLGKLAWSPDSQKVALVEKVYDWEYTDPYNRDFSGELTAKSFYLVVVSRQGQIQRFPVQGAPAVSDVHWTDSKQVSLGSSTFPVSDKH